MKRTVLILYILSTAALLFSFTFEPISTNYTPSGPRSNQVFRIVNNEEKRIAVKVSVTTRETDLNGNEINSPADDLFMIFPSRAVLDPGESKSIRVKWQGDANPETELPFRIIAEQIPVDFEPAERTSGGGIRISFRYVGNIYILPLGGKPKVILESYELEGDELILVLINEGRRHTLLRDLSIRILSAEGEEILELSEDEVKPGEGINLLTGYPRQINLSLAPGSRGLLQNSGWEVDFEFDPVF